MKNSNQEMHPLYNVVPEDAIGMLIADHKRVANLFAEFKRLTAEERDEEKATIVEEICQELTIHAELEEELFYPAVRQAINDDDQMDEALVEHASAKQLIAELSGANPDGALYDAKVTVLAEQIDHHVEEEEGSMFPRARHSGLDTLALGVAMLARKKELQDGAPEKETTTEGEEGPAQKPRGGNKKQTMAKTQPAAKSKKKSR